MEREDQMAEFRFPTDSAALRRRAMDYKPVDVSDKPVAAVIMREGVQVKAPGIRKDSVEDLISGLDVIGRKATPRVVSQSLPAGTYVSRGTPVDLVLVRPADVSIGVLENTHEGLRERSVEDLFSMLDNPLIKKAVDKGDASKVSDEEKQAIKDGFDAMGVEIDDQEAGKSFDRAFKSLEGARVFL
jgi:hypothetical protein